MSPTRNPFVRLGHIKDELDWLLPKFREMEFNTIKADILHVRACERSLLIISKATKSLSEDLLSGYPEIEWRAVRSIGNFLRHEYEHVDPKVLWRTVTISLVKLSPVVDHMILSLVSNDK